MKESEQKTRGGKGKGKKGRKERRKGESLDRKYVVGKKEKEEKVEQKTGKDEERGKKR